MSGEGRQVPQALVEEGRVERRLVEVLRRPVGDVDLQAPRQVGGPAVELLVEPVAPAPDRLRHEHAGSQRVDQRQHLDALGPRAEPQPEGAEGDRPPHPQAAAPEVQRGDGVAALPEVELPVGDHVVEPAADQAEGHRPDRQVADLPRDAAARDPAPLADPDREHDAEDDAQRVAADRDGPEVPHAVGGARDGHQGHEGRSDDGRHGQHGEHHPSSSNIVTSRASWACETSWSHMIGAWSSASTA